MSGTLVIRLKGLGDIVHLMPSLRLLRQQRPDERISFVCCSPFGRIIPSELNIEVIEITPYLGLSGFLSLVKRLRKHQYSELFDLFCNPTTAYIALLSGVKHKYGFDYRLRKHAYSQTFTPPDPNKYLTQLFADFFANFGIVGELPALSLSPQPEALQQIKRALIGKPAPLLGINPHSTYQAKAWPMSYFAEFIRLWHAKTGAPALIIWAGKEEIAARELIEMVGEDKAFMLPAFDVAGLVALLSELDYFLTCDSGPMNVAWATGTPTLALFGPTTREPVAPRGKQHLVLYNQQLDCLQCHVENCSHRTCMNGMKPEWVFAKFSEKYFKGMTK